MKNFLRKIALPTTIAMFCGLIGLNAYVAWKNLKTIQKYSTQRIDASDAQSDIVAVSLDLQAIETGQRGYLLTGDASYLTPYTQATEKLPIHFATLRSRLAGRGAEERALETELENVAASKIEEVKETLRLREKGYRHRAFLIVNSNRGQELMVKARALLDQMSAVETRSLAEFDRESEASVQTAMQQSAVASLILLVVTVITLIAFHQSRKGLEHAYTAQTEELRAVSQRLERFTSTISSTVRTLVTQMRGSAESLLNAYGGFLPHQGQERAQWIHEGSSELHRLLDDLLEQPSPDNAVEEINAGRSYSVPDDPGEPHPVELTDATDHPRSA